MLALRGLAPLRHEIKRRIDLRHAVQERLHMADKLKVGLSRRQVEPAMIDVYVPPVAALPHTRQSRRFMICIQTKVITVSSFWLSVSVRTVT